MTAVDLAAQAVTTVGPAGEQLVLEYQLLVGADGWASKVGAKGLGRGTVQGRGLHACLVCPFGQ